MDITGLYNIDGTPNREAGYFKVEESEVESWKGIRYKWMNLSSS